MAVRGIRSGRGTHAAAVRGLQQLQAAGIDCHAIAVVGPKGRPCWPCGSCRQILHEFAPDLRVVVEDGNGGPVVSSLAELLPQAFTLKDGFREDR